LFSVALERCENNNDCAVALALMPRLAARNVAVGLDLLGYMYSYGFGVKEDAGKAAELWLKAAEQGYSFSQASLGLAYLLGEGVPKDATKAAYWFRKAAEQDNSSAQLALAGMYDRGAGVPKDAGWMLHWMTKAAEQGNATAQMRLFRAYASGAPGVPPNLPLAIEWLREAARVRARGATFELGRRLFEGDGVPRDQAQGMALIRRAAEVEKDKDAQAFGAAVLRASEGLWRASTAGSAACVVTADGVCDVIGAVDAQGCRAGLTLASGKAFVVTMTPHTEIGTVARSDSGALLLSGDGLRGADGIAVESLQIELDSAARTRSLVQGLMGLKPYCVADAPPAKAPAAVAAYDVDRAIAQAEQFASFVVKIRSEHANLLQPPILTQDAALLAQAQQLFQRLTQQHVEAGEVLASWQGLRASPAVEKSVLDNLQAKTQQLREAFQAWTLETMKLGFPFADEAPATTLVIIRPANFNGRRMSLTVSLRDQEVVKLEDGSFVSAVVPPGRYSLRVSAFGVQSTDLDVNILHGETVALEIAVAQSTWSSKTKLEWIDAERAATLVGGKQKLAPQRWWAIAGK
jgi:TPR repeat protein